MFYWLFKKYMKRMTKEFEAKFKERLAEGGEESQHMTPNWYWLERIMFGEDDEDGRAK